MYTMNIGLNNPFKKSVNSVDFTLSEVLKHVEQITNVRVSYDGDEPTVIVRYALHKGSIKLLACALDQDCIAVWDHHIGKGTLIGDKADQWGEFDMKYFQLP